MGHAKRLGPTEPSGLDDARKSPTLQFYLNQWFFAHPGIPGFTYCLGHTRLSEVS